jgi:beta-galactosidase
MLRNRILNAALTLLALAAAVIAQEKPEGNLARSARASASSSSDGTKAENLNDGDISHTQWTAKDGTNPADTWVELNWPTAVQFQEIVIRQEGDRKLFHLNVEVRETTGTWRLVQSIGDSQHLLPRIILVQFAAITTTGLRLSAFTGSVSLNEVEVYDRTDPPVIELGSDLLNHIFGVVTDGFGTLPFVDTSVQVQGTAAGKPWRVLAHTDQQGIFQVDMPVGLEGKITATAQITSQPSAFLAQTTVDAGDLTPGLTLPDDSAAASSLDGIWRFEPDPETDFFQADFPDSQWKEIKVPSHWMMEGFDTRTGTGGYRRHLQIPASFRGRRIKLVFDGVYSGAEVWLNGKRIGSHEGGFSPFELDITNAAHVAGDNVLAVLVREKTLSSHLDDMSSYANFPLTGIFRSVRLISVPETHIRRFQVQTVFDSTYTDATLTLDLSVENESGHEISAPLALSLKDPEGRSVSLSNQSPLQGHLDIRLPPWSRLEKRLEFHVTNPNHWEAEHPLLYSLTATLNGTTTSISETVSRRVGFRQIEVRGTQILINGVPVKLRGVAYFEAHPLTGRSITPDLARRDLQMMKEANLDAFRTEVILPAEYVYDDADELGFYVEAESPFCWVDESSDLRYLPTFVQRTAEILDRDFSHPSVIIWSVGNESTWGPDFEAAHQFIKTHDRTRPVSAGQSATLELDTMHNPITLARMKERENVAVPILWDESFCIFQGHLWGDTREMWIDPGDRDYYIEPLIEVWDAVQTSKNVQGSMIWAWVDDIFLVPGRDSEYGRGGIGRPEHPLDGIYHMPGRGIVGDAPWGVVDGWRRKKPEFWHVKMLMSPIHLHERDLSTWKSGDPAIFTVDNRYEFTNLSTLTLEWSVGQQHGSLHPDIAPRSTGKISIPVGSQTKPGDQLSLRFLDSTGAVVIPHTMQLGVAPATTSASALRPDPLHYSHEDFWLGGPLERFIGRNSEGDNFEIAFDGGNGRIRRALVERHSVLYGTPKLHVLPIEATLEEFPIFETWRLTRPIDVIREGDNYELVESGTYRDFAGELRFLVTPQGSVLVSYDFTYTGTETRAREVGLQFGVPLWCDKLEWRRRGEWTVYPENHIGRNDGQAMAHAGPQTVPPSQPFASDDTALGTNDFRSTKRNFVFASLTDKEGFGIGIKAIGSQHLRASVDPDLIEVNVNDWFGGVAATAWGEWWQNYGQGRVIRSDDPNQGVAHNKLTGSMQLYLLSPRNITSWQQPMKSIPTSAAPN